MSENERLGIELYVIPPKGDTGTSFLKTLQESIDKISKALSAVDLSSLSKGVDKTTSSGKKGVDDFTKSISSLNNELSKTSRASFKLDGLTEAAKAVASINVGTTSAITAGLKLASTWEEFRKINAAVAKEMAGGVNSKASQILGAAWQNTKDPVTGVPDAGKLEAVNKLLSKIGDSAGKSSVEVKTLLQDLKEMKLNDTVLIGIRKMEQPQDAHVVAKDKFTAGVASEVDLASLSRQKELQAQILSESKKEAELRAAYRQADKQGVVDSVKNYQMELGFATQRKEKLIEEARVLASKVKDEKQAWQDRLVGEKSVEQAVSTRTKAEIKANADVQASTERANAVRLQIYTDSRRNVQAESKATSLMANPTTANPQLGVALNAVASAKEVGDVDKLKLAYSLLRAEISNTNATANNNPWKSIFAGMEVGKTTLDQLTAKVREFQAQYGGIDSKALSSMSVALGHHKAKWDAATQSVVSNKKEVSAWTKLFGKSVGQMAARLTEFYSLRTVIFAVGSQFREAITASIKFSQNIHDIAAISGSTKKEMHELGGSILDIARHSRFTSDEVAKLVQILAQAGVAAADLPEVAASVGRFATATGAKPEQAADLVTTSLNVFDKKAEDTASITNVLTAALNESKLTTDGLATAFNYLAPQAEQLGMSLEQTAGIIATMAQSGIKPSTIGTGTSQLLKELSAPKGRLSDLLSYYSIKQEDVDPIKHSFAEIVATFQNATGKMGEQGVQVQHVMRALETRTARSLVTAMSLGSEAFERMTTSITGTNAAWVAYYKSMDGAEAKFNVIKQNFQAAVIGVLGNFSGIINGAASALMVFTNMMSTTAGQIILTLTSVAALSVGVAALSAAMKEMTIVQTAWTAVNNTWIVSLLRAHPILAGISLLMGAGAALYFAYGEESKQAAAKIEESNKALFSSMEAIDKSSAGLRNAKQLMSDGKEQYVLSEYTRAVKKFGETSEEVNEIKKSGIKVTDNTVISLNKLKSEYPDYFADLKIEGDKVYGLVEAYEKLNKQRTLKDEETRTKYNTEVGPELLKRAQAVKEAQAEVDEVGEYIGFARHKQKALENAQAKLTEMEKVAQPMRDLLSQKYSAQATAVAAGSASKKITTGFGEALKVPEKSTETVKPIPKSSSAGASKETSALSYADNIINQAEKDQAAKRKKEAELILDDTKATMEARKAAWAIVEKEIQEETSKGQKADLDKLGQTFAKDFKGVKYDSTSGVLSGIEAYSEASKKYNLAVAAIKDKWDQQWLTMSSESYKKLSDAERKLLEDFEKESQKIREDEAKRTAELKKKELEDKFKISTDAESTMEAYYAYLTAAEEKISIEYAEKRRKLLGDYLSWSPKMQEAKLPEVIANYSALNNAEVDAKGKVKQETSTMLTTSTSAKVSKAEKQAGYNLANSIASLNLEKQRAATAEQVEKIEVKIQEAQIEQTNELLDYYVYARDVAVLKAKAAPLDTAAAEAASEATQQVQALNDKLKEQLLLKAKMEDTSFFGNLGEGARKAMVAFGSFKSMTEELGNSLTNTMLNGAVSSISSAVTTMFNPDQGKINELNAQIVSLRAQKTTLEADIATIDANTSKTPEEIKSLNDKKIALDQVNTSLAQQEAAVRKQKDAWASFAEGLKGIMKTILQELQNYIIKLFVVWAAQKLVGLVGSVTGWDTSGFLGKAEGGEVQAKANGGIVKGYADGGLINGISGGLIPMSMGTPGKDSVPIMAMPNEYVIPAHVVSKWGAGHFENYRNGTFKKMAEGGLVSGGVKSAPSSSEQTKSYNLQIVNITQNDQIPDPGQQAQQIINVISSDLARKGPTYKSVKAAVAG